jgi:hypothetical protein
MLAPLAATAIVMRIIHVMRVMQVAIPRWPSYRPAGDARLNQSFRKDRSYRLSARHPTFGCFLVRGFPASLKPRSGVGKDFSIDFARLPYPAEFRDLYSFAAGKLGYSESRPP